MYVCVYVYLYTLWRDVHCVELDGGGRGQWLSAAECSDWLKVECPGQSPRSCLLDASRLSLPVERHCDPVLVHHLLLHCTTFQICAKTKQ